MSIGTRSCDASDIDAILQNILAETEPIEEFEMLIHRAMPHGFSTFVGDSNLDGEFNTGDLVDVFQASEYEDGIIGNSEWSTGDWTGDGEFDSSDLVVAFQDGGYEAGPRTDVA